MASRSNACIIDVKIFWTSIILTDQEIEQGLRSGDENSLAQLLAKHRDRLWRIVHFRMDRRLIGRVDADDILQNSFVEAAKRIHHFADQHQYSAFVWLRMIVGQTLVDMHRRHIGTQQRDASREVNSFPSTTSASMTDFLAGHLTTPSEAAMRDEQKVELHAAVEAMEPIDREVLALRHFEELTNQEAAEVMGITQKAASIRYVRALARLKVLLGGLPGYADPN